MLHRWGPLTQFKLDLEGIDSVGGGANDVMEVVGRVDACQRTQEMLLDDCVEGFLHNLFSQKWRRFGRLVHCCQLALEATYLSALLSLTIWLKEAPESFLADGLWVCWAVMLSAIPTVLNGVISVHNLRFELHRTPPFERHRTPPFDLRARNLSFDVRALPRQSSLSFELHRPCHVRAAPRGLTAIRIEGHATAELRRC
jgi:hypothetical protein